MTQQIQFYLLKFLLLFLLFEPINCFTNEQYNIRRQDRAPFFDINPYFNLNYGDVRNQRTFEYQPYQPNYASPQLRHFQYQRHRDEALLQPRTEVPQIPEFNINSRSIPEMELLPLAVPLPYQGTAKKMDDKLSLDDKIRNVFFVGPETNLKLFNTTLDPKLSTLDLMHADESVDNNDDENTTDLLSSSSSETGIASASLIPKAKPTSPSSPSSSSSMNNDEPTFKVQRNPDGKLSLVFNDLLSLQQPTAQQSKPTTIPQKRPAIVFPKTPASETAFNGCDAYEGQSLCSTVKGYPNLAQLNTILQREFSQMGVFFAEDIEQPFNISQRFGGDPDEIDPCNSVERIIFPQAGETLDSRWLLIVNDKNSYKQGVRVEECIGNDQPCNTIDEFLPNRYRSVCKQSYVFRSLVALTENGTVIKEQFKIPSCCKCMLRNVKRFK